MLVSWHVVYITTRGKGMRVGMKSRVCGDVTRRRVLEDQVPGGVKYRADQWRWR